MNGHAFFNKSSLQIPETVKNRDSAHLFAKWA